MIMKPSVDVDLKVFYRLNDLPSLLIAEGLSVPESSATVFTAMIK